MKSFALLALWITLVACASSPNDYSGRWAGQVVDSQAGVGQGSFELRQDGITVSGTWQFEFAQGEASGQLGGDVNGDAFRVHLFPSTPNTCPYSLTTTRLGNTLTGNYAAFNCDAVISGTVTFNK